MRVSKRFRELLIDSSAWRTLDFDLRYMSKKAVKKVFKYSKGMAKHIIVVGTSAEWTDKFFGLLNQSKYLESLVLCSMEYGARIYPVSNRSLSILQVEVESRQSSINFNDAQA